VSTQEEVAPISRRATDEELDAILISIYEQFPSFGNRMIDGYFMALSERVPRRRIEESYLRVIGPSKQSVWHSQY